MFGLENTQLSKNNFVSNRFFHRKYTSLQVVYLNVNNTTEKRKYQNEALFDGQYTSVDQPPRDRGLQCFKVLS